MTIRPIPPRTPGVADFEQVALRALVAQARQRGLDPVAVRDAARDPRALRSLFNDRPPLALVAFDTPGLQDYVFRARRPIDILGGSRIVAVFTEVPGNGDPPHSSLYGALRQAGVPREAVIYAGGGGGLLLVAAHQLEGDPGLCARIEDVLTAATGGDLSSVAVALEIWPDDLAPDEADPGAAGPTAPAFDGLLRPGQGSRYTATRTALLARLARRRSATARLLEEVPAAAQARRCDVCERREVNVPGRTCCGACDRRRQEGFWTRREDDEARTFEDLVEGTGGHAMAVIYADGADFGRLFRDVRSPEKHHALSAAVERALRAARDEVCRLTLQASTGRDGATDDKPRVQTAICGGDDLALVLPARIAMRAVDVLLRTVERSFDEAKLPELACAGVGVGVAIADVHFPIHFLFDYAAELLRSAKAEIRRVAGARSAVDFLVLTSGSPLARSIEALRAAHMHRPRSGVEPALRFTQRPFTRECFDAFLTYARALAGVPPAQVFAVREALQRGYRESRSLWRYQHARADRDGWAAFREQLSRDLDGIDGLLWQRDDRPDAFSTRYLDAVEVRELLSDVTPGGGA